MVEILKVRSPEKLESDCNAEISVLKGQGRAYVAMKWVEDTEIGLFLPANSSLVKHEERELQVDQWITSGGFTVPPEEECRL
ncbi:hypothetical protein PM082_018260 [Marasmius tenuissimus]|nr:hypothetical protein PM082_018260 [Marasmius tenuissimus]